MMNAKARSNAASRAGKRPGLEPLESRRPLDGSTPWLTTAEGLPEPSAWIDTDLFAPPAFPPADGEETLDFSAPSATAPPGPAESEPPVEAGLRIVGATPSGGTIAAPVAVEILLSEPLAAGQHPAGAIVLQRIGPGGEALPVDATVGAIERVGWDGRSIVLPLGRVLSPGLYRISLGANASLTAESGAVLLGEETPVALAEFRVAELAVGPVVPGAGEADDAPRGPILEEAEPLALEPGAPLSIPGAIDSSSPDSAVALYRIDLPPGPWRRIGLEVRAGRDGSMLDPALALLDGNGRLIAQADRARVDSPSDPFFFQSLAPGTYYVAVTSEAHRPALGGYDAASGSISRPSADPTGVGSFTLDVVADPVGAPTSLVAVVVDRADPASTAATGLTLGFDGPMRTTGARVELVDAAGRVWTARSTSYDEATGSFSFLFDEAMPGGTYTLRSDDDAPLVDLGGRPVVAPAGRVGLATVVLADPPAFAPGDLGALLPGPAGRGVATTLGITPEGAAAGRFVVTQPGQYSFRLQGPAGSVSLIGPDGSVLVLEGDLDPSGANGVTISLAKGAYRVVVSGSEPGTAPELAVRCLTVHFDDLLTNGLGQGPAFRLRTIAPLGGADLSANLAPGAPVLANPMPAPGGASEEESLVLGVGMESAWIGGLIGRPEDPATGGAAVLSQGNGQPGGPATGGPPVSPAQGGLARAGDPGVFWSVDASAESPGGADAPISTPALPVGSVRSMSGAVDEPADEGLVEVASNDEMSAEEVLALLADSTHGAAASGIDVVEPPVAEAATQTAADPIGLGDYRLGLGIALVAAWGVRHQIRRRRTRRVAEGREGRASVEGAAWGVPAGPRWSLRRGRFGLPRLS